jgi:hypothetical protein
MLSSGFSKERKAILKSAKLTQFRTNKEKVIKIN